jgi:hypothetical protein
MKHSLLLAGFLSLVAGSALAAKTGKVSGMVSLDNSVAKGPVKVWVIQKDVNNATEEVALKAIDSTTSLDGRYEFELAAHASGSTYLVKVALEPGNTSYGSYLPTYLGGALIWHEGTALGEELFNNTGTVSYDINMQPLMKTSGPGVIGGRVVLGEQKGSGNGASAGRQIILTNAASGQPVASVLSDVDGYFHFNNLPLGDYYLSGDEWNKTNPKLGVPLIPTEHNVMDIVFRENDRKFYGQVGNVGVGHVAGLKGVSVFPVPASDFVTIAGLDGIAGASTIELRNVTGAQISQQAVIKGTNKVSVKDLSAGMYLVLVHTQEGTASYAVQK